MYKSQTLHNSRGSIFVLVLVVTFLTVMLGYLLFQTNTNLYKASEEQTIQSVLERNMSTKAERAFALSASLNANGSWFTNTPSCPSVTLSGNAMTETIQTYHAYDGSMLSCAGIYPSLSGSHANFYIQFTTDSTSYTWASYKSIDIKPLTLSGWNYSATFTDIDQTIATWSSAITWSDIDANLNSDNFRSDSYSGTQYRILSGATLGNEFGDDDSQWRKMITGFAGYWDGFINIYWNTPWVESYIKKNPNNHSGATNLSEPLWIYISDVASGAIHLEVDGPSDLRIIEYDKSIYRENQTRKIISTKNYSFTGGINGYLTSTGITNISYDGAPNVSEFSWNMQDHLYGLFLRSQSWAQNTQSQIRYILRIKDISWKDAYIAPLIDDMRDANNGLWKYWSNDIILLDSWDQYAREWEVARPIYR